MQNSDVIKLFSEFSKDELIKFGDFLKSPYHNTYQVLISLYDTLKKYYPDFSSENLSKEKIFGKLYPSKEYNDGIMRNIISDMKNMIVEFKTYEAFRTDKYMKDRIKLNILKRELFLKNFSALYENCLKKLDAVKERDSDYYYNKSLLENDYKGYLIGLDNKTSFRKNFAHKNNVQSRLDILNSMMDNLVNSFGSNIIRIYIQIKRLQHLMFFVNNEDKDKDNYNFSLNYYNSIESLYNEFRSKHNISSEDLLYFDYNFFSLQTYINEDKEEYINKLIHIKDNELFRLNKAEIGNLYSLLITYMHGRVIRGNLSKLKDTFELIKEFIESKCYRKNPNSLLPDYMFINTLDYGLVAGEIEWTEKFYTDFINEIPGHERANVSIYCEAHILYSKNKHEEALERLSKVIYDIGFDGGIFVFKVRLKILHLKIIYELNEHELFYSNIDAFRHFVSNNKALIPHEKERILNFISYFKKLFHLKNKNTDIGFNLLNFKTDLLSNNEIEEKIWLITKTEQLELS